MAKILLNITELNGYTNKKHYIEILNYSSIKDELEFEFFEPEPGWGTLNLVETGTVADIEIEAKKPVSFVLTLKTSDDTVEIPINLKEKYILDTIKYRFPQLYIQFVSAPYFKVIVELLEKSINNLVYHFQDAGATTTDQQLKSPRLIKGTGETPTWDVQWHYIEDETNSEIMNTLETKYIDADGWITIPVEEIEEAGLDVPKAPYRYISQFDEFTITPREKNKVNYLSAQDFKFHTDLQSEADPEKKFTLLVEFINYFPTEFGFLLEQVLQLNINFPFVKAFLDKFLEVTFEDSPEIGGDIKSVFVDEFEKAYNNLFLTETWDFDLTN